jgi:hypothetical protein
MKTSVYSWRVDPDLKSRLSDVARSEKTSVSKLLDRIVGEWLSGDGSSEDEESTQARLHGAASQAIGSIRGGRPSRAEEAAGTVKERVRRQRGR